MIKLPVRFNSSWDHLSILIKGMGFPSCSNGKESACDAEDLGSIPELGRSSGERNGNPLQSSYPLQYSWASLVAQLVKNLPAMRKTWVWSLGWEDPLEKEKATHSSILGWRIPWTKMFLTQTSLLINSTHVYCTPKSSRDTRHQGRCKYDFL